ncbi:hypothetical protein LEP1GSC047_3039 [Leptospira inadai serovar Lyme str. 10]|uniref:Uncharacterized protein n=1 Tax=Leptospira inadai serovar Lyme str. 10 TaxID=1049790 RepID=V6HBL4_9LEPT|nr:hypothetical protein LEP1GSC047_3039 [Leptospira inadai serovar Lyme str. 10]
MIGRKVIANVSISPVKKLWNSFFIAVHSSLNKFQINILIVGFQIFFQSESRAEFYLNRFINF